MLLWFMRFMLELFVHFIQFGILLQHHILLILERFDLLFCVDARLNDHRVDDWHCSLDDSSNGVRVGILMMHNRPIHSWANSVNLGVLRWNW